MDGILGVWLYYFPYGNRKYILGSTRKENKLYLVHFGPVTNELSRVLLEKLIVIQLVKKFSAFYRTHYIKTKFTYKGVSKSFQTELIMK
jgi:hypothetical protein